MLKSLFFYMKKLMIYSTISFNFFTYILYENINDTTLQSEIIKYKYF